MKLLCSVVILETPRRKFSQSTIFCINLHLDYEAMVVQSCETELQHGMLNHVTNVPTPQFPRNQRRNFLHLSNPTTSKIISEETKKTMDVVKIYRVSFCVVSLFFGTFYLDLFKPLSDNAVEGALQCLQMVTQPDPSICYRFLSSFYSNLAVPGVLFPYSTRIWCNIAYSIGLSQVLDYGLRFQRNTVRSCGFTEITNFLEAAVPPQK